MTMATTYRAWNVVCNLKATHKTTVRKCEVILQKFNLLTYSMQQSSS